MERSDDSELQSGHVAELERGQDGRFGGEELRAQEGFGGRQEHQRKRKLNVAQWRVHRAQRGVARGHGGVDATAEGEP